MITESLFLLLTSLVGIVTLSIMLFSINSNKATNLFLILIVMITCTRFILRACFNLGLLDVEKEFMDPMKGILLFNLPLCFLYFLYFKSIINDYTIFNKKFLLHFIIPSAFIIYVIIMFIMGLSETSYFKMINFMFLIVLSIYYNVQSYFLFKKSFWNVHDKEKSTQYKFLKRWSLSIYSISIIWMIGFFISLFLDFISLESIKEGNFLFIQSIVWLVIFVNIIMFPELLLGLPKFEKRIINNETNSIELSPYWKIQMEPISNQKDAKLKEKIDVKIINNIKEIEFLAVNQQFFRNQKITIVDFANEMNIPLSHLVYLFKYHCQLTFTEYKTQIKIDDSKQLIESGFLTTNTLDSLAKEVGFSSYNPFFNAFKKIVGMSPKDYY